MKKIMEEIRDWHYANPTPEAGESFRAAIKRFEAEKYKALVSLLYAFEAAVEYGEELEDWSSEEELLVAWARQFVEEHAWEEEV